MDTISEWIKRAIEQGSDRPIEIKNLAKQEKSKTETLPKPKNQVFQKNNFNKFNKNKINKQNQFQSKPKPQLGFQSKPQSRDYPGAQKFQPGRKANPGTVPGLQGRPFGKPAVQTRSKQNRKSRPPPRKAMPKIEKKPQPLTDFKGLRIIPIGGLDEIGKNMTAYEYNATGRPQDKEIIVVDMGLQFPEEDMLGVDYVIPDSAYLEENKKKIKAIVITHGHLDHIGGIPYILPKLDFPPVYATRLTKALIEKRLEEFQLTKQTKLMMIDPIHPLKLGSFNIEFFRVAHSIPDSVGVVVSTPEGRVVYTGDFKFDDSPAGIQPKADLDKIRSLGSKNILALLSDSTNALKAGHTMSEADIGRNLEDLIGKAKGRVIIASFSSLFGRIQQIFEYAKKHNRKIYVSGRSIRENIEIGLNLKYLQVSTNQIHDIAKVGSAKDNEVLIMTTGSQGEDVSALTKIALSDHPHIKIKHGDTVIISSTPIVGNERAIYTVVNNLCMLGANVIHSQISKIHTSGHGYQDELSQMIQMVRPKYFIPVHGEYFMRQGHKQLAIQNGIPEQNCFMLRNGEVLEIANNTLKKSNQKVEAKYILIDGLGEGTIGSQVMSERLALSENGIVVIIMTIDRKTKKLRETPNVLSRGFMYMHEYEEITAELGRTVGEAYKTFLIKDKGADRKALKRYLKGIAERYTHQKLERRPLILPLIFEV